MDTGPSRPDGAVQAVARRRADPVVSPGGGRPEAASITGHRGRGSLGTACEFLRFCAIHELVDAGLVAKLYETRELRVLPPGYEAGEDGQFRAVRSRVLRFVVPETPFEFIEPDRVDDSWPPPPTPGIASSSRSWR